MKQQKRFDRTKSILRKVYECFEVNDPGELQVAYMKIDQSLMKSKRWDHRNSRLTPNKIKNMIEKVGVERIRDQKEKQWIRNILWMWYHHATGSALWRYGDKRTAKRYSRIALALQNHDHPNKITRLLYFLTRDSLMDAERWADSIHEKSPEKKTANYLIELYKQGRFFKRQLTLSNKGLTTKKR